MAPLVLRDYFGTSGSGHDLTVWVQTEVATISFPANDIQSVGISYINLNVPASSRHVLTEFVLTDRFILALTRPSSDPKPTPTPTPEPVQKPAAPTGLSGRLQDGDVTLSWTAPTEEVTGYSIFPRPEQ